MKNYISILFLMTTMLFAGAVQSEAQQIAYVNSSKLLAELPEVKKADSNLNTLQKQMQTKGQEMVQELQAKYQELAQKEKQGELSPKQIQEQAAKLQQEEQEIAKYEQEMMQTVNKKREELLQPILDKINNIITEVAKENGYNMVLDSSSGVVLYADESDDITDKVKAKLGM